MIFVAMAASPLATVPSAGVATAAVAPELNPAAMAAAARANKRERFIMEYPSFRSYYVIACHAFGSWIKGNSA